MPARFHAFSQYKCSCNLRGALAGGLACSVGLRKRHVLVCQSLTEQLQQQLLQFRVAQVAHLLRLPAHTHRASCSSATEQYAGVAHASLTSYTCECTYCRLTATGHGRQGQCLTASTGARLGCVAAGGTAVGCRRRALHRHVVDRGQASVETRGG
jgi:hypothetical protein